MSKLKTACLWLMVPFALPAADFDPAKILTGIEDRYNHIQTLQVDFVQTYKFRGPTRIPEKGTLYLHKPRRMRWEYSSPAGKLFISDGKFYYDYNPEDKSVKKTEMKEDDDLRGPLAFLLGKLNFKQDFGKYEAKQQGDDVAITAFPKSDQAAFAEVSFVAGMDFAIKELTVKGQDGDVMHYVFSGEKKNPPVSDTMFRFTPPPGVQVVDDTKGK
jgi:outer membrane lipoprotein carrier protein